MKRYTGALVIVTAVVLTVIVWIVFPPENDGRENFMRQYAGEVIGSINIVLLSFSLFMAARPKWAEPYFGGLDKMYVTHRQTSTAALLLIFAHVLTVPISLTGWALGNYLAVVAFIGIVSIALISLSPRIAFLNNLTGGTYEGWKKLKRFVGIFFILGFFHSLTIADPLHAFIAINWVQLFFIFGSLSYLYTEFSPALTNRGGAGRYFKKYLPYTVESVKHPNASTTEVTLRAKNEPMPRHRAGQFLFVRFPSDKALDQTHPFTISSAPHEDMLRVTIKASGDFTRDLFSRLEPGMDAVVEGAYGMFNYKTGGPRQIWIAGGIGLTPFLSFVRDMSGNLSHDVHLFYTVRHPDEALFVDEILATAAKNPRLKIYIRYSATQGSLTVEEIARHAASDLRAHHIYMCGPLPMIQSFERKFLEMGVPGDHIHYEEFNFR